MARRIAGPGYVIEDRSQDIMRTATTATERAVTKVTVLVQAEAIRLVGQKSSLGASKDKSIPRSKPGQPPFTETGHLLQNIGFETFERKDEFRGRVGTNVKYGRWLEVGTSKMAPRPYLRPAFDRTIRALPKELRRQFKRIK